MKKAFTLAETLITLGIIGIVAALTIPTLIASYNTKTWNTTATVFERKLSEALRAMNTQQSLAGHTSTKNFVEELSKHFKTSKICTNNELTDCFPSVVYWGSGNQSPEEVSIDIIKNAENFGQTDWETEVVGILFANGVSALIAYNPLVNGPEACTQDPFSNKHHGENCIAILYDINSDKNPNTLGKDLRANKNVKKLGRNCAVSIGETCYTTTPFYPTPVTKAECEQMVVAGYGIENCEYDEDYWAGAVKECGGIDKLPTQAQITELANHVYNGTTYTLLDTKKATSLGFDLINYDYFRVWSNKEHSAQKTYVRHFGETKSYWSGSERYSNLPVVMCLGK